MTFYVLPACLATTPALCLPHSPIAGCYGRVVIVADYVAFFTATPPHGTRAWVLPLDRMTLRGHIYLH